MGTGNPDGKSGAGARQERLAAALRENLKRRKAQARALARAKAGRADEKDAPEAGGQKPAAKPPH